MNAPESVTVPPLDEATVTSFAPAVVDAGVLHVIVVEPCTVTPVAATPPIVTPVMFRNPLPVITIGVRPLCGPALGLTEVIASGPGVGGGVGSGFGGSGPDVSVMWTGVPPSAVTVTSIAPCPITSPASSIASISTATVPSGTPSISTTWVAESARLIKSGAIRSTAVFALTTRMRKVRIEVASAAPRLALRPPTRALPVTAVSSSSRSVVVFALVPPVPVTPCAGLSEAPAEPPPQPVVHSSENASAHTARTRYINQSILHAARKAATGAETRCFVSSVGADPPMETE